MLLFLLLAGSAVLQDSGSPRDLSVGSIVRGEVVPGDPSVDTEHLIDQDLPTRGVRFRLPIEAGGPHTLEARSDHFNAYLVLRDAAGEVLAENDDGLVWFHARIATELASGTTYLVDVVAQDDRNGPFEVAVRAEPAPPEKGMDWREPDLAEGDRWLKGLVERDEATTLLYAFASNDLGQRHWMSGGFVRARDLFVQSIDCRKRLDQPRIAPLYLPLNNLALAFKRLGDLDGARRTLEQSLAMKEAEPESERDVGSIATSLHNLGGVLIGQGDYDGARRLLERALDIREAEFGEATATATTLASLSVAYDHLEDPQTAMTLIERAVKINRSKLRPGHPRIASCLNNLAELQRHAGDYESAARNHEEALSIFEQAYGPYHADTATSLNNIGTMHRVEGYLDKALPFLIRSHELSHAALGPDHPDTMRTTGNLAMLHGDRGDHREAWDLIRTAQRGNLANARRVLATSSESEGYSFLAMMRWQLDYLLNLAPRLGQDAVDIEAYEAVLAWKGRLSRLMLSSRESLHARLLPEQRQLLEDLRTSQAALSRLARAPDQVDADEQRQMRSERNRLEVELHRTLDGIVPESEAAYTSVRASLPPDSALIDFFVHPHYRFARVDAGTVAPGGWADDQVFAWITRPDADTPIRIELGSAEAMDAAVREFLTALAPHRGNPIEIDDHRANWLQLGARLWEPLAPHLEGAERIFVSPDGFLGKLPFETLPLEDDRFLIERLAFVYLQDASSLERPAERAPLDSLFVMGAVDFNKAEAQRTPDPAGAFRAGVGDFWPRIPATEFEAQLVHDLHEVAYDGGQRLLLRGPQPEEQRLKGELHGYAVLHLATHGFFEPEEASMLDEALARGDARGDDGSRVGTPARPLTGVHPGLLSGLVCAGANRPGALSADDGYLTAEEVAWLDLSDAELVVLSACETGLGARRAGEGMIGLRRAFRTAGASTVISSLWSVRDEKTAELMGGFYRNLWLGQMGVHEALRAAQLKMLDESRRENRGHGEPSTWGAFVLSGDWR
jgi:CHAT domain-containing protein